MALALVGRPRLVLLDEPTTGLDVEARRMLWQALRDYHADGATMLLTSHYLEEIEALAQRVVVIGGGRVLADDALPRGARPGRVRRVAVTAPVPESELAGCPEWPTSALIGEATAGPAAGTACGLDSDAFVRALVASNVPFSGLEVRGASLEEAFLTLTTATPRTPVPRRSRRSLRRRRGRRIRRRGEPAMSTTTTTAAPASTAQAAGGTARLALLHTKFQFLETVRIPIAVIGNLLFPTRPRSFFVVPQPAAQEVPAVPPRWSVNWPCSR